MTVTQTRPAQPAAVLTEDQIDQYYLNGYIVVPGLVPADTIERVRATAGKITINADAKSWQPASWDYNNPENNADLHELLVEPHIVTAVTQIFEAPARCFYGMLAIVPAHGGNGLPWHQDNMYTTILGRALNTFVALSEITPDKAMLWVAPQSHRRGVLGSEANTTTAKGHREATIEPANGTPLSTMKPGDVCIFDRNTLHRSLTNTTDTHRYAYAAQYMEEKARMADTGRTDPLKLPASDLAELWGVG